MRLRALLFYNIIGDSTEERIIMGKNQHVTPNGNEWQVIGAGNQRATKMFDTQYAAIDYARDIARNQRSELVIHGRDGRIRTKDSYGNDPYPPKG